GVWCAAIGGIVVKLKYPGRLDWLSVGLYLALGWSGLMLYDSVVKALPALALCFILAGGIFYTLGVVFHAWRRLRFQNAI
ncbi:hemolysin III family protein, partial [Acinetobacter baumannii]